MAVYEVYRKDMRETPKKSFSTNTEEEAIAAYRAEWDKGEVHGDFIRTSTYIVVTVWRKR